MSLYKKIVGRLEDALKNLLCYRRIAHTDRVFLTFDDGPEPGITEFVLEQLKRYDAKATFFCVGKTIQENEDLYKEVIKEGHTIASHTMNHSRGQDTPMDTYCNEVAEFATKYNTKIFRPPFESLTIPQLLKIKRYGFKIVLWSHDSTDWFHDTDAPYDVNTLLKDFTPGSIILFHSCQKHEQRTKKILPGVLEEIKKRGLKCDTIMPEML